MTGTRITVDSVIDKKHVRVLISTDGKTEQPVIMEMDALKELVKGRKELFKKDKDELKRDLESEVISFTESRTTATPQRDRTLSKKFGRKPMKIADVRRDLKGLKKSKTVTTTRRSGIRRRQTKIRERMGAT